MTFPELVKKARTHRRFVQSDPIPRQALIDLVDLARFVPSGGNQQPLRYRVVSDPAECAAVFKHLRWAAALKDWGGPAEGERPTGYIAILVATGKPAATDVGIAAQTIQLAATEKGYATCMIGSIDRPAVHALLKLPAELDIQLIIAVGRPGERVVLEEPATGETRPYWRTPDGVHHVPKRKLEDTVV